MSAQTAAGASGDLFRSDVAGTRVEPAFEPVPVRLGSFLADVRMSGEIRLEDNVFNQNSDERGDLSLALDPAVGVRSDWGRHAVSLNGRARFLRYRTTKSENRNTFDLRMGGRFDAHQLAMLSGALRYGREAEDRGSAGANQAGAGPAFFHGFDAQAVAHIRFDRTTLDLTLEGLERRYEDVRAGDGGSIDQSFRDTRTITVAPRVLVALTPMTALFVAAQVTRSRSIAPRPGARRDATGTSVIAGIRVNGAGPFAVEAGLGRRTRDYDLARYRDFAGITWDVTADWYPTQLISFRLQAGQDFRNSGLQQVPAILVQSVSVTGYYDMRRNVRLKLSFENDRESYREIGLTTNTSTATLSGTYSFGPRASARLFLRYRNRGSTDPAQIQAYDGSTMGLSLTGWL